MNCHRNYRGQKFKMHRYNADGTKIIMEIGL